MQFSSLLNTPNSFQKILVVMMGADMLELKNPAVLINRYDFSQIGLCAQLGVESTLFRPWRFRPFEK